MRAVWKFPVPYGAGPVKLKMPLMAKILHSGMSECVGLGRIVPHIWAEVDDSANTEIREFEVYGTGHIIKAEPRKARAYVGTVFEGPFVWHIYEVKTIDRTPVTHN